MNNYVISIHPQPLCNIMNGTQTIIILKRIPKPLKRGELCTFWVYCMNGTPYLWGVSKKLNGLVVCKFVVEKYTELIAGCVANTAYEIITSIGMTEESFIKNYVLRNKPLYALHITALEIIEPLPLSAFKHEVDVWVPEFQAFTDELRPVTHAPQSFTRVLPPKMAEGEKR